LGDCKNALGWRWKTEEAAGSRNSASSLAGGEGGVGEKPDEAELYPLVGSDGVGGGQKEVARRRRRWGSSEHQWRAGKLVDGSVRVEGDRRRWLSGKLGGGGDHGAARLALGAEEGAGAWLSSQESGEGGK
jgi:hypothetical protein